MIDDELDLFREQARIYGMDDRAHGGDGVINLQMPQGVGGQSGDPVSRDDAQAGQRIAQLPGAVENPRIGAAHNAAIGLARDDLAMPVKPVRMQQDRAYRQLEIHHRPDHLQLTFFHD